MKTTLAHILKRFSQFLAATFVALPLVMNAHHAFADHEQHESADHEYEDGDADFDDALEARQSGAALPLGELKQKINRQWPGEILKIEVKRRAGNLHYEFKVLRPNGHLMEIEIDAHSGKILEVENE